MGTPEPSLPESARPGSGGPGPSGALARGLVLAAVVVLLVAGFVVAQRLPGRSTPAVAAAAFAAPHLPRVGERAPDFTARTTTGEEISLAQFRGRPVWLTFGASWCAGCRAEAPDIEATYRAAKADGIAILAVYLSEDTAAVNAYASKLDMTYPQIPDPSGAICNLYGARVVPMHVFVGADGVVRRVHAGILTPQGMREAVAGVRA